jgi:hypothetical protein
MGPDTRNVAAYLQYGREFGPAVCRGSLGVSTDEPLSQAILKGGRSESAAIRSGRRIYIFPVSALTADSAAAILSGVRGEEKTPVRNSVLRVHP